MRVPKVLPRRVSAGLPVRAVLAAVACLGLSAIAAAPVAAATLLPHKVTYRLTLDGSKPSGQLEEMSGEIAYELTGDVCTGYTTNTRQVSEGVTGDSGVLKQEISSTSWEAGDGNSYRFKSKVSSPTDGSSQVEASVARTAGEGLKVTVAGKEPRTLDLKGQILMPTEHVVKVLAAAAQGERTLEAKVYDGASDPAKVFDTLAVIGRPSQDPARIAAPAKDVLAGRTFYPVTVSYFDEGQVDKPPAYVMNFSLYDNGVVGGLKIDYGRFALVGAMATFEALKAPEECRK